MLFEDPGPVLEFQSIARRFQSRSAFVYPRLIKNPRPRFPSWESPDPDIGLNVNLAMLRGSYANRVARAPSLTT